MQVLSQYGPRKSKPRVKRNYANSNKLWHFLAAIIWHTFFGKYKNLYVSVLFLLCFIFYLRAISQNKPPGAYIWRGNLTEGFLCYEFEGLIYLEGLIHGEASFWNFMVYCCSITEEPLLLSVYLTIVVNKAEIEKHKAISINSPDYYYNKWISL